MKYIILANKSSIALTEAVMALLETGWNLQGGVSCSISESDEYCYELFAQALIKEEKPEAIRDVML